MCSQVYYLVELLVLPCLNINIELKFKIYVRRKLVTSVEGMNAFTHVTSVCLQQWG